MLMLLHVIDYTSMVPRETCLLYLLSFLAPFTDSGIGHVATFKGGTSANMILMESDKHFHVRNCHCEKGPSECEYHTTRQLQQLHGKKITKQDP